MADDLAAWLTQIWDDTEARYRAIEDNGGYMVAEAASPLSRIAADRQILALHQPFSLDFDRITGCKTCSYRDDYEELQVSWPCPTVRLLALPYADRPGYQEEWRVTV